MRILSAARQSGKSTRLASWAKEDPVRVILCATQAEVDLLTTRHSVDPRQVASWSGGMRNLQGRHPVEVAIDNLEFMIIRHTPFVPVLATTSWPIELIS